MGKYIVKRLLHGAVSVVIVTAIVMVMIYSMLDRSLVFTNDAAFARQASNSRDTYSYGKWEQYGYLDYVTYQEWLSGLARSGEIDEETRAEAAKFGRKPENDSELVAEYAAKFQEYYESQGYTFVRKNAKMNGRVPVTGGQQIMFVYKDKPLTDRLVKYFTGLVYIDNIHRAEEVTGERGLTFTWHDPAYGGTKLSPAIIGNGTTHKYLLYVDNTFPYIHQNFATIHLGESYSVNTGVDVFETMTTSQGVQVSSTVSYPTGLVEVSADDLHSAVYMKGSLESSELNQQRFTDDYTSIGTVKNGYSKLGYSFIIGIISVIMAYVLGLPLGLVMSLNKDGLLDKIGTCYIIFISAVPSLAYIFIFRGIGMKAFNLPGYFDVNTNGKAMYILPIVSLALPSVANLMKWMRRYMIDQMNSDYVKFARSGGLSEREIFTGHIMKNAAIPITHGIPGSVIFAMTGAIITERIYTVPGAGGLLTTAINKYDNGVIVGVTLFYAILSVVATVLGDVLMATVDPRISFTTKDR